jgi:uncharacterized membrane protein
VATRNEHTAPGSSGRSGAAGRAAGADADVVDPDADLTDDELLAAEMALPQARSRTLGDRRYGWVLLVFGLIGFAASLALSIEKVLKLQDPDHVASCSFNLFLDCSAAMGSWQGSLLGFPNPFIGVAAFPVVVTSGVVLLAGARLPAWYWRSLLGGTVAALGLVVFLVYTSVAELGKLCPYCMVVWFAVIPLFWYSLVYTVQERMVPASEKIRSVIVRNRFVLLVALYLVVTAWVVIALAPAIADHLRYS